MDDWSKEPWRVAQDYLLTREGGPRGTTPMQEVFSAETPLARFTIHSQLGDAARAVQCVNACAGIADPAAALDLARLALESAPDNTHYTHWDPTGGAGSGCPACTEYTAWKERARAALAALSPPPPDREDEA